MRTCVYVRACASICVYVRAHIRTCARARVRTRVRACEGVHVRERLHVRVCVHLRLRVCACEREAANEAAHVSVCACACMGTHAYAGCRTCVCACVRECIFACMIYHIGLGNYDIIIMKIMCRSLVVTLAASSYRLHEEANVPRPRNFFFPINAPGMGRIKLFDLVGYS